MSKLATFSLFYLATFLQAGTYGLTFMLPRLFEGFGGNEKHVGLMLLVTTATTLVSVYYSGHLTDRLGRLVSLGVSGFAIALSLLLYGMADGLGFSVVLASAVLGFGWGTFYTLGPVVLSAITPADQRVRVFSLNSVFMMAGFGLSPVMASMIESAGFEVAHAFLIMAAVCVASGALFIVLRPSIQALQTIDAKVQKSSLTLSAVGNLFKSRACVPIIMVCLGASVFAGMNNFQTVFADDRGLRYADFFLAYTITVVICRILLAGFSGGKNPYAVIAGLQYIMFASVVLFVYSGGSQSLYLLVAVLFGIGYGASYPVLAAMAANDAEPDQVPQTLQFFALTYFIGIFAFPLVAGWMIVEVSTKALLVVIAVMAIVEATMALRRSMSLKGT